MQGLTTESAARHILEVIARQERESVMCKPMNHFALYLNIIAPSVLDWILRKRAKID